MGKDLGKRAPYVQRLNLLLVLRGKPEQSANVILDNGISAADVIPQIRQQGVFLEVKE